MRYRQNTKGDILYGPPVTLSNKYSEYCIKLSCLNHLSRINNLIDLSFF